MKHEYIFTPFYSSFLRLCEKKGKSPTAVAQEAKLSSGSPTAWKNGSVPKRAQREKLCAYFGVTEDELLGYKKEEPASIVRGGWEEEAIHLLNNLSPDERARELAYLRERVTEKDK